MTVDKNKSAINTLYIWFLYFIGMFPIINWEKLVTATYKNLRVARKGDLQGLGDRI